MASFTVPCPKCLSGMHLGLNSQNLQRNKQKNLSFQNGLCLKPSQSFRSSFADPALSGFQCLNRKQLSGWKLQAQLNPGWKLQAQLNQATTTIENSLDSAPKLVSGSEIGSSKETDDHNGKSSGPSTSVDASSISASMTQVSNLVKLVDSRDIVELQFKQSDCEVLIRKKEALQPPLAAVSPPVHYPMIPSPPPPPAVSASVPAPASPPTSKPAPASPFPAKTSASSHPSFKCPMAGTFYRSPTPGEPPFVKVGDKVQKGQILCIIEAMKLMNEIEADQSGTIAEILADDGKPVSVDTPLFVIVP